MTLHPAIGGRRGNRYCGPAALSCVFGISTGDAAALLRDVSGARKIIGVTNDDLTRAMYQLGAKLVQNVPARKRMHLDEFARCLEAGIYVVNVTGHYVTLDTTTMEVCDNHTIYPLALSRYSMRRKCVKTSWKIVSIEAPTLHNGPTLRDVRARVNALGATIHDMSDTRTISLRIDAPAGHHFADGQLHGINIDASATTSAQRSDVYRDVLARLADGLDKCDRFNDDCLDANDDSDIMSTPFTSF